MKLQRTDQTARLSPVRLPAAIAALAMFGGGEPGMPKLARLNPAKERCAECGCKIPPGKAGRKCESCRGLPAKVEG